MKKNQKFISIMAITLASLFIFSACAKTSDVELKSSETKPDTTKVEEIVKTDEEKKPAESTGKVTVDIMQLKVEIKDALEEAAKAYMKENPNVNVIISTVGGGSDYKTGLKTRMASGNEPTIFNVDGLQAVEDWKTKLTDLSDTQSAKTAIPVLLDLVRDGDKIYGVPYNQEGFGFIYNKDLFAKAGIDPKSIVDFNTLESAVKLLDSKKAELGLTAVFAFPVKETWVTGLHLSDVFIQPEMPSPEETFLAKEVAFKYGKEFKQVFDLENAYSVQPTISMDYSTQVEELFSFGKVAMIQQGNWAYPTIAEIDPEYAANLGFILIPCGEENKGLMPAGPANFWAVNSNKDEATIQASKDFLDWLNTSEAGKEIVLTKLKFVPAYSGYDIEKIGDPLSKEVYKYSQENKTTAWTFSSYPANWGMDKLGAELQKYASGSQSWDDTLNNAKATWAESRK